ncbi:TRAP transporter small permease subunit [Roseomonas sp. SSH11]|uniref:TRAP transporter small permease protein n=1 Tax=Pararoseomonas baculiformis TaxID=2820812 RepID=A0ABS4ACB8_9PROT|nr:TRAP transporter small permease subunit [Pararoseomonas baculiformis]MBP0444143.1 TRAP transporter small permease subunit [Pararoseomonas baculiformis]
MQRILLGIDRLSTLVGQAFAWCIVALTAVVTYEVVARYAFRAPTTWGYDVSYMLYGTLFMMAGAYALSRNGHVRGDFLYRMMPPRRQAWLDLVLYILFFFPAILAFMISGWHFFQESLAQNERSMFSPSGPVIWPFKFLIPLVGLLLLLQGLVEVVRCIHCIRDGVWPKRLSDVEEMDQLILAQAEARGAEALAAELAHGRSITLQPPAEAVMRERSGDQQDGR